MRGRRFLRNLLFSIILQIIVMIYGFIVPKIIISNYGSEVNGLIASITQFLSYIALLEAGFGPVVKSALYGPIAKKDKKAILALLKASERFFKKIALIFVLYIIVLLFVYPYFVNNEFDVLYTVSLIIIISMSTFAEYFFGMTYRLFLNAKQEGFITSIIQISSYIISLFVVIFAVKFGASIHLVKLICGLVFIMRPLLQNFYVKKKYEINLGSVSEVAKIEQKWDGLAQHVASVIHTNTDVVVLTIFSSLINVSIYSVYAMVTKGIRSVVQPLSSEVEAAFGDMIAKRENSNLLKKYSIFEVIYNSAMTIVFSCAIVLIVPFVKVYTTGIADANYINETFAILLLVSEYIWAIRQPYNGLIKASGHFKQTRIGAWVECLVNIVLSIVLVRELGLAGVAIGTLSAMAIRTVEFIIYVSKNILRRRLIEGIGKILIMMVETLIIVFVCSKLSLLESVSYTSLIINSIAVLLVACAITFCFNIIIFKNEIKGVPKFIRSILKKKEKK